ncbi:MAG: class I SAM-dependent methyltransferase [Planctomycetes bacterium]|nr:class I SAM-dependent methyltransferase [Planctomycetota bacterium]
MPNSIHAAPAVPVDLVALVAPTDLTAWRTCCELADDEPVLDLQRAAAAGLALDRLPFADRQFAFGICRGGLDELDDPAAVLRELQRVARRGVIELTHRNPRLLAGCPPAVQWLASTQSAALVLQRRPFVAHPFGQPAAALGDAGALGSLASPARVQRYFEDRIPFEVHDDGGYCAADPAQRALAHLDLAEALLRHPDTDADAGLAAATAAVELQPDLARAHYVRGQWLWRQGQAELARAAVLRAAELAPDDPALAGFARGVARRGPAPLPPPPPHALDLAFWQRHAHDAGIDLARLLTPPRLRHAEAFADEPEVSRFVRVHDRALTEFLFPLPTPWWSRGHEYAWAQQFAGPEHVVLDAACGIEHPLKFALAERCRTTVACDLDPRLVDDAALLASIPAAGGDTAAVARVRALLPRLQRSLASITALPDLDETFDRVFCISVLEHLPPPARAAALREFARVLRHDGIVVLTMDHPLVDLAEFERAVAAAGLRWCGEFRRHVPLDALGSPDGRLRCFRALLAKA